MRTAPLALILGAVACVVALVAARRRGRWRGVLAAPDIPATIDRAAFEAAGLGAAGKVWLVATFTDRACRTCASTLERLGPLAGPGVELVEVEAARHRALHDTYRVDAVPLTLVADADGAVIAWILGPPTAADIASVRRTLTRGPLARRRHGLATGGRRNRVGALG